MSFVLPDPYPGLVDRQAIIDVLRSKDRRFRSYRGARSLAEGYDMCDVVQLALDRGEEGQTRFYVRPHCSFQVNRDIIHLGEVLSPVYGARDLPLGGLILFKPDNILQIRIQADPDREYEIPPAVADRYEDLSRAMQEYRNERFPGR